jgi:hypothetical protein
MRKQSGSKLREADQLRTDIANVESGREVNKEPLAQAANPEGSLARRADRDAGGTAIVQPLAFSFR